MADRELVASVRASAEVMGEALARQYGGRTASRRRAVRDECHAIVDDLFARYRNRALADPLERVARDPVRKLAGDDRLVGAARLGRRQGLANPWLCLHILDACAYGCGPEDPARDTWPARVARGWRHCLMETAGLDPQEELMRDLELAERQRSAAAIIRAAGIHLKDDEVGRIETADFGLGRYPELGLAIYVYVNTARCCAKELAMLPGQICPEHRHPRVSGRPGKEETFRCRGGEVHLFLPGDDSASAKAFAHRFLPADKRDTVTVYRHVLLLPGDQCTLPPDTRHWFVAGDGPAVVSEFSTRSRDEADIFTDPAIRRVPVD
jgi:D-lyxose ketol-isomerase